MRTHTPLWELGLPVTPEQTAALWRQHGQPHRFEGGDLAWMSNGQGRWVPVVVVRRDGPDYAVQFVDTAADLFMEVRGVARIWDELWGEPMRRCACYAQMLVPLDTLDPQGWSSAQAQAVETLREQYAREQGALAQRAMIDAAAESDAARHEAQQAARVREAQRAAVAEAIGHSLAALDDQQFTQLVGQALRARSEGVRAAVARHVAAPQMP